MIQVGLSHFLALSGVLFAIGVACVLTRRNAVAMLIGVELMLNAAGLNFVAFSRYQNQPVEGALFALFIIVLAAAEAVVALGLILALQNRLRTVDVDSVKSLKE